MLLRFIIWMIIIFIAAKIAGVIIRYIRALITPNRHINNSRHQQTIKEEHSIEDIPYEDVTDKK
jgi:hypothetical protein